jgi:hypothetical protein
VYQEHAREEAQENEWKEEEEEASGRAFIDEHPSVVVPRIRDCALIERVLKFMGFTRGVETVGPVMIADVKKAIANNGSLSTADSTALLGALNLSASVLQLNNIRKILKVTRGVAMLGVTITDKLLQRKQPTSRGFCISKQ